MNGAVAGTGVTIRIQNGRNWRTPFINGISDTLGLEEG